MMHLLAGLGGRQLRREARPHFRRGVDGWDVGHDAVQINDVIIIVVMIAARRYHGNAVGITVGLRLGGEICGRDGGREGGGGGRGEGSGGGGGRGLAPGNAGRGLAGSPAYQGLHDFRPYAHSVARPHFYCVVTVMCGFVLNVNSFTSSAIASYIV